MNIMPPAVSVVIPAYNSAATVAQAVDAALAQTGVIAEVLVIDDGSTDDTGRVLGRSAGRVRTPRPPTPGPAAARNHRAWLAEGEWLAFLDADDDWAPGKLAAQLARADAESGLVYTDCLYFGDTGRVPARQSEGSRLPEGDV